MSLFPGEHEFTCVALVQLLIRFFLILKKVPDWTMRIEKVILATADNNCQYQGCDLRLHLIQPQGAPSTLKSMNMAPPGLM